MANSNFFKTLREKQAQAAAKSRKITESGADRSSDAAEVDLREFCEDIGKAALDGSDVYECVDCGRTHFFVTEDTECYSCGGDLKYFGEVDLSDDEVTEGEDGDPIIEKKMKKAVRNGKITWVPVKPKNARKKRRSAKQRLQLKKAAMKSQTSAAKAKREKSFDKGQKMNLHQSELTPAEKVKLSRFLERNNAPRAVREAARKGDYDRVAAYLNELN